jgi:hypothetical protein
MTTASEWWHPLGLVLGVGLGVLLTNHNVTSAQDFRAYLPQAFQDAPPAIAGRPQRADEIVIH